MTRNTHPWIEVWPLDTISKLNIIRTRRKAKLSQDLSSHVEELWRPKVERRWKSSWVPFVKKMSALDADHLGEFEINLGVMAYKEIEGVNDSIEKGLPFAPRLRFNPCLSVGFITATKDGKVIFQRRPENVHCPNVLIHEPCGYMTSLAFAPRAECDRPEYADDPRLFSLKAQLDYRKNEIARTIGVAPEAVTYQIEQDLLGCGWKTIEMYFSSTGIIDAKERELRIPEKGEFFFVPFERLRALIYNQGRLSQVDPAGYKPKDPREIPLIDESLAGLIWGYEKLTGERLDIDETVERLSKEGLEIRVHDTSPGKSYDFSFD